MLVGLVVPMTLLADGTADEEAAERIDSLLFHVWSPSIENPSIKLPIGDDVGTGGRLMLAIIEILSAV